MSDLSLLSLSPGDLITYPVTREIYMALTGVIHRDDYFDGTAPLGTAPLDCVFDALISDGSITRYWGYAPFDVISPTSQRSQFFAAPAPLSPEDE